MKRIKTKMIIAIFSVFLISFTVLMLNIGANQGVVHKSQSLIKDNYPSVKYSFELLKTLDAMNSNLVASQIIMIENISEDILQVQANNFLTAFENNLKLQQNNITEPGEQEITEALQKAFNKYSKSILKNEYRINYPAYHEKYQNLRKYIISIHDLNVTLLESKNETIKSSALRILNIQEKVGIAALIILCVLILTLPMMLINPIDKLTGRMIEFYKTNFNKDIVIESNHELEKLEEIFEKIVLETNSGKSKTK